MVYSLTPTLTYITEDHYVCDEKGHRAQTSSGSYVKVVQYRQMVRRDEDEIYEPCSHCRGYGYFITKRVRIRKPKILQTIACDQCKGSGRRGV